MTDYPGHTAKFPLFVFRGFGASMDCSKLSQVVQADQIVFVRSARTLWTCYSCKEANLDWEGRDNDLEGHVRVHQDMAGWFYSVLRRNGELK